MSETTITFEATPNPATFKFNLPNLVTEVGFDCPSVSDSDRSPLAAKIFGFPWATSVYIGPRFITVTKQDWIEWSYLVQPIANLIAEHLHRGEEVVLDRTQAELDLADDDQDDGAPSADSAIIRQIKKLLDREIRPVVALDGGDIEFSHYANNILFVKMRGACAGCPSATATLKNGVEARVRQVIPEVREVVSC